MYTLVLNLGLKSIRSIVFDSQGKKLAFASHPVQTFLKGDQVTQNPEEWWEKGIEAIKETIRDSELRKRISYITVTSSSCCLIPAKKDGKLLMHSLMVSDKRAHHEAESLRNDSSFAAHIEHTRLNPDASLMIPKILWIRNNESEIFEQTEIWFSSNSFLTYRFTGRNCTDYLDAQKYHYNTASKKYPEEWLNKQNIRVSTFPEVQLPGADIGTIRPELAEELELRHDCHFVISTYDAICAFFGSGPKGAGDACDVSGTVTSLRVLSPNFIKNPDPKIHAAPIEGIDQWLTGGSNNLGGGLIEWVKQSLFHGLPFSYEAMETEAKESTLGASGLIFLPYLLGERAPIWNGNARGVFFGLERTHTRKDMTRAVFESAGFSLLSLMQSIEKQEVQINRILVSGGLARIHFICQLKADITGKEVHLVDEFETTALGAAMFVGIAQKKYKTILDASSTMSNARVVFKPNLTHTAKYAQIFSLYNKLYSTLVPLFEERVQLLKDINLEKYTVIENL